MVCLLSVLEPKKNEDDVQDVKTEPIIHNLNRDYVFNYNDDQDYSPPHYNRLYGWD